MELVKAMEEKLGMVWLTGEADATQSGRILFDVPTTLADGVRDYLGAAAVELPQGWNSREKFSIMLQPQVARELAVWLLRRAGHYIIGKPGGRFPEYYLADSHTADEYRTVWPDCWVMAPFGEKLRNVHVFSGREV